MIMVKRLLRFIQRLLPSSKSQVNHRFDILDQRINCLNQQIYDVNKTVKSELEQKILSLTKDNSTLQKKVDTLCAALVKQESNLEKMIEDKYSGLHDELGGISSDVMANHEEMGKISSGIMANHKEMGKISSDVMANYKEWKSSFNEINRYLPKAYLYNNPYECRVIKCFQTTYDSAGYESRFLELIKGLDHESIQKIVTILRRQQLAWENPGKDIDLYTRSEQDEIKDMKKYMLNHIFQVSENLFCYDHYFLPVRHFETSVFYFKHGIHELQKSSLDHIRGKDIIDVGGFIGDSVVVLEDFCPRRIYTFEGVQKHFELIKETLRINHIQNCIAEHLALGAEAGQVTFDIKGSSSNMQTIDYLEQIEKQETVEVITLDAYASEHDMDIGLIKVDIEGAEQQFLQGARKTIEKFRPILLLSIYHNADDFFGIKPMIEEWNLGYRFHIHKPCDYSISREVLLLCEPMDGVA